MENEERIKQLEDKVKELEKKTASDYNSIYHAANYIGALHRIMNQKLDVSEEELQEALENSKPAFVIRGDE